ncbi:SHOCT domain-containing protein [Calditrichota bacterium GD2]
MMEHGMGFGWVYTLIFVALAVWLVYQIVQRNSSRPDESVKTPLEILKERYARGEISKPEFDRMKDDLK